jgi:V8-like Glu-specific endopeptidase
VKPALTLASAEVQFDPPLSTATCVEQPAIPGKTYSVLTQTIRSGVTAAISGGPFDGWTTDWAVFRTLRNSTTKKTPYQEQGAHYKTDPTGAQFNDTTIIGFGTDGGNPDAAIRRDRHCADCWSGYADSNLNRTQQTHSGSTGPLYRMENVFYTTHTCGGNSGSLLLQPRIVDGRFERRVVGVHTGFVTNVGDNGCVGDVPINRGTNIAHAPFRARISEVCNMCDANNDKRVDNADLADIRNALGLGAAGRQRMNPDNDAQVTVNDLRLCSLMCTNANCQ